ncbi:MAG: hypothetical protein NTV34_21810, partial [Proteobacteria bacterium]|nr:hypothetical protein [Pseudomonadota bacterium]
MSIFGLLRISFLSISIGVFGTGFENIAAAAAKTLVTYEGGKVGAGVAKSWKKGKGSYSFVID